jgi:transcriptional regulator with XRE-family HTH domain
MNSYAIGQRIASYRNRVGLSTAELGDRVGRSQATISRIENGKQTPHIDLITRIAEALTVHPFCLLADTPPPLPGVVGQTGRGGKEAEAPVSALARMLCRGRERSRLNLRAAARALEITPRELQAYEAGERAPALATLERAGDLYPVDAEELLGVAMLEKRYPELARRLNTMSNLLAVFHNCLRCHAELGQEAARWRQLTRDIEAAVEPFHGVDVLAEREAEYFSIGHLSDTLLKALQDPAFHAEVERRARRHQESGPDAAAPGQTAPSPEDERAPSPRPRQE